MLDTYKFLISFIKYFRILKIVSIKFLQLSCSFYILQQPYVEFGKWQFDSQIHE